MKDNLVNESGGLVNDCISRRAAIDAAECIVEHHSITPYKTMAAAMDHLKRILNGMPSAQPRHIKGRWVGTDYDGFADGNPVYDEWKCSECGCVIEDEEPTWNFCPFCGSDMRGDEDALD